MKINKRGKKKTTNEIVVEIIAVAEQLIEWNHIPRP
jgi:hypothetical protein